MRPEGNSLYWLLFATSILIKSTQEATAGELATSTTPQAYRYKPESKNLKHLYFALTRRCAKHYERFEPASSDLEHALPLEQTLCILIQALHSIDFES